MKKQLLLVLAGICFGTLAMAQKVKTTPAGNIEYEYKYNDPNNVSKLLILGETTFDVSTGMGLLANFNLGAVARYAYTDNMDIQVKISKSVASFESGFRKNFEFESYGALFSSDVTKMKRERVNLSSTERGNRITTTYFDTDLPQRNAFGFNAGWSYKTLGLDPNETYDFGKNEGYKGNRNNVNFSTVSLIGGLQFKRINASVIKAKRYRNNRIFDNYVVMTIDGIFTPVNSFKDAVTGENVGDELKADGLKKSLPLGARFTYNVYGSIPKKHTEKGIRYTVTSAIGHRPYLGFSFEGGIGLMLYRQ